MAFSWRATVVAADDGRLLRDWLRSEVGISSHMLIDLKYKGSIRQNGVAVTVRARVKAGDLIELFLPETADAHLEAEDLPLTIVYEDEDLLVVNKPAGMIVHPVPPEPTGTLANAVAWHWQKTGSRRPVRIVTRLDRDTSGLVLIAKHALAQHLYTVRPEFIDKYYLALVNGTPQVKMGLLDAPIAINRDNPVTRLIDESGKPAQTAYQVLSTGKISLLQAQLLTGRTHQIRLHLAWIGHPVLGDEQYGQSSPLIARQALHCHALRLTHIRTKQELCLLAPLADDMLQALKSGALSD